MCFENLLFEATTNLKNYDDFKNRTKRILNNFTLDESKFRAFKKRNKDIIKNNVNEYNYSKIKLFENSTFEIYVIFWFENSESPYHDHAEHGCYYKVLIGNLLETILKDEKEFEPKLVNNQDIAYIDNYLGYHKIKNIKKHIITDKDKVELFLDASVSIHFYSPPNYHANLL
jgi:hypothetical protein